MIFFLKHSQIHSLSKIYKQYKIKKAWPGLEFIWNFRAKQNIPDAFPIRLVSLKPMVTAKHNIIKVQLISGMYICPWILDDVCTILTRGKHPSAWHCLMMEKVPVIMAWLPTTAARIAIPSTGHLSFSAKYNFNFRFNQTNKTILRKNQKQKSQKIKKEKEKMKEKNGYLAQKHKILFGNQRPPHGVLIGRQLAPCKQELTTDTP